MLAELIRPGVPFALAALLSAAPVLAALPETKGVPEKGEGTVAIFGGPRFIPGNGAYLDEQQGGRHQLFQPGALAAFGYQFDDELHFTIDFGYGIDRYRLASSDLLVRSFQLLLGVDTVLSRSSWYTVYGGGGIGYSLNTGTRNGLNNEANSTAVYLAVGWRIRLAEKLALVFEDRYTLANAAVDPMTPNRTLNVGGNLLLVGLLFHFLQPDEKGMAPHMGD